MKQYRFQCYAAGLYFTSVVNAADDQSAINGFAQNLNDNKYSVTEDGFGRGFRRPHLTYEELDNGTTKVDSRETSVGVQMGKPGVVTG
tara:strand:- start:1198 stop:1461 length:264 start_codon:yes stop_codon:yes gene_type:complete